LKYSETSHMSLSEKIIEIVIKRMSPEDKERLLETAIDRFFQDMTAEEKEQFVEKFMRRLLNEVDVKEVLPQIMAIMWKEAGDSDLMRKMTQVASQTGGKLSEVVTEWMKGTRKA
jgi:uncharacterized membrane-anchored protein YjiN (DUF445 family)